MVMWCKEANMTKEKFVHLLQPTREKRTENVFFLIIHIFHIVGICWVIVFGLRNGLLDRYIFGVDSWGKICHSQFKLRLPATSSEQANELNCFANSVTICVRNCPRFLFSCDKLLMENGYNLSKSCMRSSVCNLTNNEAYAAKDRQCVKLPGNIAASEMEGRARVVETTTDVSDIVLHHETVEYQNCVTCNPYTFSDLFVDDLIGNWIHLVAVNWKVVIGLAALGCITSWFCNVLLAVINRWLTFCFVTTAIAASIALNSYLWFRIILHTYNFNHNCRGTILEIVLRSVGLTSEAIDASKLSTSQTEWDTCSVCLIVVAVIATAVNCLCLLLLAIFRHRLLKLSNRLEDTRTDLMKGPCMLLLPLLSAAILCLSLAAYFASIALVISDWKTVADMHVGPGHFGEPILSTSLIGGIVFCSLWMTSFVVGCQHVIVADVTSRHYFHHKSDSATKCATLKACYDFCSNNLGTVALASLVSTFTSPFRLLGELLRLLSLNNHIVDYCLAKVFCGLGHATYICVGMYGQGYWSAVRRARSFYRLDCEHDILLGHTRSTAVYFHFIKFTTTLCTAAVGFSLLFAHSQVFATPQLSWLGFESPLSVVTISGLLVALCYTNLRVTHMDAISMCYLDDVQRNGAHQESGSGDDRRSLMWANCGQKRKMLSRPPVVIFPEKKHIIVREYSPEKWREPERGEERTQDLRQVDADKPVVKRSGLERRQSNESSSSLDSQSVLLPGQVPESMGDASTRRPLTSGTVVYPRTPYNGWDDEPKPIQNTIHRPRRPPFIPKLDLSDLVSDFES